MLPRPLPDYSSPELADRYADRIRQRLLAVPSVSKVELFGVQDEKLYVEISQKRLAVLGLDFILTAVMFG